jgi:subtilisin family serine protease
MSALLIFLILTTSGSVAAHATDPDELPDAGPTVKPRSNETSPDHVIVKFRENVDPAARAEGRRRLGLRKVKDLDLIDAEVDEVEVRSAEAAARALEHRPDVEYATPDRRVYRTGFADEPYFVELWGLNNTGQSINGTTGTSDVDVNAKEASARTRGDPSHVVAVVDDGVDYSHPDLADRAWKNPGESGSGRATNGIDDDGNGYIDDLNGWDFYNDDNTVHDADDYHGTHIAGTIAASVNGQGVVGVAPNVKIMALKFLGGPDGSGTISDAIEAIGYAKSMGVKISNNSWGYFGPADPALRDAINASGQLFVAAAGNEGVNNDANPNLAEYPASYDSSQILSVAAIGNKGNLASFSNYGAKTVDICAPGVDVLSSVPDTPPYPGATLTSVGDSGKALVVGFGIEEISAGAAQVSFVTKAFAAVKHASEPVVLVDDDRSHAGKPDVGSTISTAIHSATGTVPQVVNVQDGDGPDLSKLQGKTVVWATGQAFNSGSGHTTLTSSDQATLTSFLNDGGNLVLTGMDALWLIENTRFVTTTLRLRVRSDVISTAFEGTLGTAFAGESYDLRGSISIPDYHDEVAPASAAAVTQGTLGNFRWGYFDGTSMATPHATGTAALVASKYPNIPPTSIKSVVMSSGKTLPAAVGKTVTGKMVDAKAALFPRVTTVSPEAGMMGVAKSTNIAAKFSDGMNAATINTTTFYLVKLVKAGTTIPVRAEVSYDSATKTATLIPNANLTPNSTYVATVKGGKSGVKNVPFNDPMVSSKSWMFTSKKFGEKETRNEATRTSENSPSTQFSE